MNFLLLNRRKWIISSALLISSTFLSWKPKKAYKYILADKLIGEKTSPFYIPFNWATITISPGQNQTTLAWTQIDLRGWDCVSLRITSATDVRSECTLLIKSALSGIEIGRLDIRYAHYMQPFELNISKQHFKLINEGFKLEMIKGNDPFSFFSAEDKTKYAPESFLPQILVSEKQRDLSAWRERIVSLNSIQTFGWMEGCVMDGLLELSKHSFDAKNALKHHLEHYFGNNSLVYANYKNKKIVETITSVESILPFAILAQMNPSHRLLQTAIAFCKSHANKNGIVAEGSGNNRTLKTEECYTVSYPLAVMAKTLKDPELEFLAIQSLKARINALDFGDSIFQRRHEEEKPEFENWARGVAWYLLGMVKTLALLPDTEETQKLKLSLTKAVDKVIKYQQDKGLWFCFMHEPETGLETSGTAGIAAALHYGYQKGLLTNKAKHAAQKAWDGLQPYFTPDGYLKGTVQVNKGGPELQRNNFRVISPYTLGFVAHLNM